VIRDGGAISFTTITYSESNSALKAFETKVRVDFTKNSVLRTSEVYSSGAGRAVGEPVFS